ncbi:MAG: cyclic beta 1-2 glucan synthetase, partial [Methanomicrobiales archaeon HGW-Methanomicrobiales-4]
MSWSILQDPFFWTAFIISLYLIPPIIVSIWRVIKKPKEQTWNLHLHDMTQVIQSLLAVPLINLTFLPYEAFIALDAIFRSCWRMIRSHHHLLEWTTHQEAGKAGNYEVVQSYRIMWPAPVIGVTLLSLLVLIRPISSPAVAVFALAWIVSPIISWWISQPIIARITSLTLEQERFLRGIARRTWRFFETFITVEDHYLLPDNFQEYPVQVVAHRTSPTNIGLSLLASLTAYDFGYIPMSILIERTKKTFTTMGQLNRYRGHFYNWYNTITLEPLIPRYISTVDSGNLVGDLLVLKQGLYELPASPVLSKGFADGLSDTLNLLSDTIDAVKGENNRATLVSVRYKIAELKNGGAVIPGPTMEALRHLTYLDEIASEVLAALSTYPDSEVRWWAFSTKQQIEAHVKDFKTFVSWESTCSPPDTILDEVPQNLSPYVSLICTKLEELNRQIPTIRDVAGIKQDLLTQIGPLLEWINTTGNSGSISCSGHQWLIQTLEEMRSSSERAEEFIQSITLLADQSISFSEIDYEFLYDHESDL